MKKSIKIITFSLFGAMAIGSASLVGVGVYRSILARKKTYSTENCNSYFKDSDVFHDQAAEYISNYEPKSDEDVTLRLKVSHGMALECNIAYTFDYNKTNPKYNYSSMKFEKVDEGLMYDYWIGIIPHNEAPYQYHFEIKNNVDNIYYNIDGVNDGSITTSASDWSILPNFSTPKRSQGATWYSVMPESYYNGNTLNDKTGAEWQTPWGGHNSWAGEWFGGDLSGIQEKEDYLYNTLNVTALFLNPIWVTAHNAGYGCYDFFQIDSSFGNDDDLLNLVRTLHKDDLKIMLDAVFQYCNVNNILNNISELYPDLLGDLYYNFGQRDENGNQINSYWGGVIIDFSHQIARDYIYSTEESVMLSYLIFFGIDAWRMDVGETLSGSDSLNWGDSTQILADIRTYLKEVSDNILFLSEHAYSNQLTDGILDSKWNYAFNKALLDWCQNNSNAKMLASGLENACLYYPRGVTNSLYNFLTTHDQSYFYENIKFDKTSFMTADLILFTFPGSPCIYFGEEFGKKPDNYTDTSTMKNSFYSSMSWDEETYDFEIFNYVRSLTSLRKEYSEVFTTGGYMNLYSDIKGNENDLYAFARFSEEDSAIVIANRNENFVNDFSIDVSRLGYANGTILYDYLTGKEYSVNNGSISIDVAEHGSILVTRGNNSSYLSELGIDRVEENTKITKVGPDKYLLKGEATLEKSNFAYFTSFNNSLIELNDLNVNGKFVVSIKNETAIDSDYYSLVVEKNKVQLIYSKNGIQTEANIKEFKEIRNIKIMRENDNFCKVFINDEEIQEYRISLNLNWKIKLGFSNISGLNEFSPSNKETQKQIYTDFSTKNLGSWIDVNGEYDFNDNYLSLKNGYTYSSIAMDDVTISSQVTLASDSENGLYIGQIPSDYVYLGTKDNKIIFAQVINGQYSIYGEAPFVSDAKLIIEKSGTFYYGMLDVNGSKTIVGKIQVNYSKLYGGLVNNGNIDLHAYNLGLGNYVDSIRDNSYLGDINFSTKSYEESALTMKYLVSKGTGFAYTNGGIKETSKEEDSIYSFANKLTNFTATFSINFCDYKDESSYVGVIFDANSDFTDGYTIKIDKNGSVILTARDGSELASTQIENFDNSHLYQFHLRTYENNIYLYGNNQELLISYLGRTPKTGYFGWISHEYSYELRSYNIYKANGNYSKYQGEMYVKEKGDDVTIELANSSSTNYCGLSDLQFKYFNIGFNLQLSRISPIKRGYFDFQFGTKVGAYYLDGVVFRLNDQGKISLYVNNEEIVTNLDTNISNVSSVYLNFTYQNGKLTVLAKNYGEANYFIILDREIGNSFSGTISLFTYNAGAKLNHIKGRAISGNEDVTKLPSYTDTVIEEPIPENANPINEPMSENYHNDFTSNSSLATLDRYSGQSYIEDENLIINGSTTVNWDAGAAIASGTFSNFKLNTRFKVENIATSGGFVGVEFYKSATAVNHQASALTIVVYGDGYAGLFVGNGILTSYGVQLPIDEDGYYNLTVKVVNGVITFGSGETTISVSISSLSNNNKLSSGFISLNAGAAIGVFDYVDVQIL